MAELDHNTSGLPITTNVTFENKPLFRDFTNSDLSEGVEISIEHNGVTETYALNTSGTGDLLQKQ